MGSMADGMGDMGDYPEMEEYRDMVPDEDDPNFTHNGGSTYAQNFVSYTSYAQQVVIVYQHYRPSFHRHLPL